MFLELSASRRRGRQGAYKRGDGRTRRARRTVLPAGASRFGSWSIRPGEPFPRKCDARGRGAQIRFGLSPIDSAHAKSRGNRIIGENDLAEVPMPLFSYSDGGTTPIQNVL